MGKEERLDEIAREVYEILYPNCKDKRKEEYIEKYKDNLRPLFEPEEKKDE